MWHVISFDVNHIRFGVVQMHDLTSFRLSLSFFKHFYFQESQFGIFQWTVTMGLLSDA